MDQIITFDKSLQTRLEEYHQVFSGATVLPYSTIQNEWNYYLELTLDPSGWQAIWKIPRLKCEEMKISFPTIVLVYVVDVSFKDLNALVKILAVQDDIHLPEKHYVPLIQLWPTKDQDKSIALNLNNTANALDMLRFFYIHILRPWDEDDDSADWKGTQLITRLRLYYDLKNGKIPKATAEHIYALLNEARRLNSKREHLRGDFDSDAEIESGTPNKEVQTFIKLNVRLIEIQNEMQLLENEMFRNVIIERDTLLENVIEENAGQSHIWLIFKEGMVNEYITFLKLVEEFYPNQKVTFATNLMSKLESVKLDDIILLNQAQHTIKDQGVLLENITIRGIGDKHLVEIMSLADDVTFDYIGEISLVENVTINCKNSQCAILVRKGSFTIRNCKIIGSETSSTCQGILVLSGAKLNIYNCDISGFSISVVGNSNSVINIRDSVIDGAYIGVKIYDNCQLELHNSKIKNCRQYGVLLQTDHEYSSGLIQENFDTLKLVSHITYKSVQGENNQKGDAVIQRNTLKPMDNLFADSDVNLTVLESSDEEMETSLNNTVLRVDQGSDDDGKAM